MPQEAAAELAGLSLGKVEAGGALRVHRLIQEVTRTRQSNDERAASLAGALTHLNAAAQGNPQDVRTWDRWAPLAPHLRALVTHADVAGIAAPTVRLMNELGVFYQSRALLHEAEPLMRRAVTILMRFKSDTGHEHPNWRITKGNYAELLEAMGRTPNQIRARLNEIGREFGMNFDESA